MLSPAVLFVAVTGLQTLIVRSDPVQEIDFRTILELAQQQVLQKDVPVKVDNYESTSKEQNNNQYASLSSREILELIKKSTQTKHLAFQTDKEFGENNDVYAGNNKHRDDAETYGHYDRYNELNENQIENDNRHESNVQLRDKYKDDEEKYQHSRYNEIAWKELQSQINLNNQYQDKPRQRVSPNNIVGSYDHGKDGAEDNAEGYSKVYVILNPKAIAKSKNKNELNNLLVKILSLTASSLGKEQGNGIEEHRYKGFHVKPGFLSRRSRRDEMPKDSMEDDYKPKRQRNGGGGGGGGAGGRTAIPYIRHRGDIYERDN